jgi:hypothetical protein
MLNQSRSIIGRIEGVGNLSEGRRTIGVIAVIIRKQEGYEKHDPRGVLRSRFSVLSCSLHIL